MSGKNKKDSIYQEKKHFNFNGKRMDFVWILGIILCIILLIISHGHPFQWGRGTLPEDETPSGFLTVTNQIDAPEPTFTVLA